MTFDDSYASALVKVRAALDAFQAGDKLQAEIVLKRDEVFSRYRPIFSKTHAPIISRAEFDSFLEFSNNHHWTNLQRKGGLASKDLAVLRRALTRLLDEAMPIRLRLPAALRAVKGMGPALATAILTVAEPSKYGVWNGTSQMALEDLGLWPAFARGVDDGRKYETINALLLRLAADLRTDLWTLDAAWWWLGDKRKSSSIRTTASSSREAPPQRAPTSWLVYWRPAEIEFALEDNVLDHAAGNQLARTEKGDRLWICSRPTGEDLCTIGYIDVEEKTNHSGAEKAFGRTFPFISEHHILGRKNAVAPYRVSLRPLYSSMRFQSESPTLKLERDGQPLAQQLQTNRRLSAESAAAILRLWQEEDPDRMIIPSAPEDSFAMMEELDELRMVVVRKEQALVRKLMTGGRDVGSCVICGRALPVRLLVAAHIKPRAECSESERRDHANNVVLMCTLGCDALFEKGFIAVVRGEICAGWRDAAGTAAKSAVSALAGRKCLEFSDGNAKYYQWKAANQGSSD